MIIVESRKAIKQAKRKMKRQIREYGITLKDICANDECQFHYNTIKAAFNPDSFYWNQTIIDLTEKMINEKKGIPQITNS